MQRSQRPLPTPDPENSRHTIPLLAANPIGTAECALRTSAPEMLCQIGADPNNLFFAVGVNVAGVPVEPSRPRRHIEICLDGDLGALSAEQLAAIVADACRRSGGLAVRIVCITEGSIRLVLSFDQDAAVVFKSLYDGQRLFQLNGFRVSTELLGSPRLYTLYSNRLSTMAMRLIRDSEIAGRQRSVFDPFRGARGAACY